MSKYYSIGDPNHHSKSPEIHSATFSHFLLNHTFEAITVASEDLEKFIEEFCADDEAAGFSITAPHKQAALQYMHEISENTRVISAVNCVHKKGNLLFGYNTDASGFSHMLKNEDIDISGKTAKLLGAGGGARAVCQGLMRSNIGKIVIYNRTFEKAETFATEFGAEAFPLQDFTPNDCDIIINATSVGLNAPDDSPVPQLNGISPNTVVVDIIYSPFETKFLKLANEQGCKTINGWKMLVFQGWRADEIWLGMELISNDTFRNSRSAERLLRQRL